MRTGACVFGVLLGIGVFASAPAVSDDRAAASAVKAPAVKLAPAAGPDFSVALSPASVSLSPGGHATLTVSTHVTSGAPGSIALAVSGLPAGVTGSLSPASVAAGGSATLTLAASASASPAAQTFTVTGVSGSATHALQGGVAIVAAPKSDFSIVLSPASAALSPGAQATFTVSTAVVSGAPMSIALSLSGLPPGVTGAFTPSTVPSGGSATLTLAAAASAAPASKTFVVSGTAGAASHTAKAAIAVQSGRLRAASVPR